MKRKILFGSILVVFLMLLVPTIPAVEYNSSVESNEDILQETILKRIEELKEKDISLKGFFKTDPDGPFEGGLDDIRDWWKLIYAISETILLSDIIVLLPSVIPQYIDWLTSGDFGSILLGILYITLMILDFTLVPISVLEAYGDAFDIIDPNEDGY